MVGTNGSRPLNEPCGDPGLTACHVAYWIWKIVPFVLLSVGTCGNVLAIMILSRRTLRQFSSTIYLLFLAVSDLTQIWTALFSLSLQFAYSYDLFSISDFSCMTLYWLIYTSGSFSIWILVIMTIERTLAIKSPIHIKSKINGKVTMVLCSITLIVLAIGNGHYFVGQRLVPFVHDTNTSTEMATAVCVAVGESYAKFERELWPIITFVLYNFLPMITISIGNLTIFCTLKKQGRVRQSLRGITNNASDEREARATRLLFILSIFFLVTTTPYFVFAILFYAMYATLDDDGFAYFQLAYAITEMLLLSNFTFNFFLYFLSGSVFKTEWRHFTTGMSSKVRSCLGLARNLNQGNVSTVTDSSGTLDTFHSIE